MKKDVEYQIIIGCNDPFLKSEYVKVCKNTKEMLEVTKGEGIELTDEQL